MQSASGKSSKRGILKSATKYSSTERPHKIRTKSEKRVSFTNDLIKTAKTNVIPVAPLKTIVNN